MKPRILCVVCFCKKLMPLANKVNDGSNNSVGSLHHDTVDAAVVPM